MEAYVKKLKIL